MSVKKSILRQCLRISRQKNNPKLHPEFGKFHHFSFVIQNNKILEWGTNKTGDPLTKFGYPEYGKMHSENSAYFKAKGILDHSKPWEMVNIRLNKRNEIRVSKPCKCCSSYLRILGCKMVWFTTEAGWAKVNYEKRQKIHC